MIGLLVSVYGKVVGGIWCGNNFLHGNFASFFGKCAVGNYYETIDGSAFVDYPQVPVYVAEIAPQNMRGSLGSVNQVGFVIVSNSAFYPHCFSYYPS